ncbi:MAG: hypothetical protein LBG59_08690 [Candidatus Peribacteria bacterium]|nr:hypothetical protein [Candidatus Peribacteria bacterium]
MDKVEELTNKVAQVSMELGGAKEFELYYEVKEYQGKERRGIKLPQFKILQKNYLTETGDEIDLYAETPRGKKRIFELKYKEKQIGDKEIEKLLNKLKADQYVMISKVGFSQNVSKKYRNREDLSLIQL